jgi:predicted RNA-binding Zn ribbon-like protein
VASNVPASLRLAESLLNSVDVESGADDLVSLPRFRGWLAAHQRRSAARTATEADLSLARELRDGLREQLLGRAPVAARLNQLAATVPLAVRFDGGGNVELRPAEPGVRGVLGEVLASILRAECEGTWRRLKICSSGACRFVYYDRSKNASRRWCSMEVCGNRCKTTAYRQRQRTRAVSDGSG